MATETTITAVDQCKKCIDNKRSFVLQGGAGSGKTESLKELLIYISQTNPKAKAMCITHTNVAVNEIQSRTGNAFPVSTIHSFLNSLIKDYKKNIHTVIGELFLIPEFVASEKMRIFPTKNTKRMSMSATRNCMKNMQINITK